MTKKRLFILFLFGLFALCGGRAAQAQCTVLSNIQIDVITATGGATVTGATGNTSTGTFSVNFGNLNGLGIGTPPAGVTLTSKTASGALYTTPISIRPIWSGVGCSSTVTIKVYQDSTTSADSRGALREGATAAGVITVPTSQASATLISTSATNNTSYTRYVGIFVSNANGGGKVTGSLAPKLRYQVSIP